MPQIIIFDGKSCQDDTELDTPTFLKMLRAAKQLPKTAAPPSPPGSWRTPSSRN